MATNFILYINNLIKESDFTKEQFVENIIQKIDKNRATIFNYLNGKTPATIEFLEAALEWFGANVTINLGQDKEGNNISYNINFHGQVSGKVQNAPKTQFIEGKEVTIRQDEELASELHASEEKNEMMQKQLTEKDVLIDELRDDKKLLKKQIENLWNQLNQSQPGKQ